MTEAFLQYVWQHQLMGRQLVSTDGRPVRVLRAGELNHDAGPDFFNARIAVDDIEWAGNVEVHVRASDWNAHHHSSDKAYNSIILHVVYENDAEVTLGNGKHPLTVELKRFLDMEMLERYDTLMRIVEEEGVACADWIASVPQMVVDGFLDRLLVERIESKAAVVYRLLEENHGGWEQTCYCLMAHYFGGKVNAMAFEMLAKSVDQRFLARWKNDPQRIEALLMGQAGLLDGYFNDDYPRQLQADYNALRTGTGLQPMGGHLWKFYCLRPSSFPTIRISQFARLVSESSNLFAKLLSITDVAEMTALFNQQAADYWSTHYRFDKESERSSVKHVGKAQAEMLVINAWVPLLFVYGASHGQQQYKDQAIALLRQIPAENNAVVRKWRQLGVSPDDSSRTQALLQLNNNYCNAHRCLDCAIGYHIIKRK